MPSECRWVDPSAEAVAEYVIVGGNELSPIGEASEGRNGWGRERDEPMSSALRNRLLAGGEAAGTAGLRYRADVAVAPGQARADVSERPRLVFFYSPQSGKCRRAEGYLAQVLQRRHNHETFDLHRVSVESRPDLAERFKVESVPTIVVVEGRRIKRRITAPDGCRSLERELAPWLR